MVEYSRNSPAMTMGKRVGSLAGILSLLLGLFVLYGWLAGSHVIISAGGIGPGMNEKTALCFVATGIGLLALRFEKTWLVLFTGAVVLAVVAAADGRVTPLAGLNHFLQHVFERFGTGETPSTFMAPYTATVFLLAAAALLTHAKRDFRRKAAIFGLFGPLMMALPTASLVCYAVGIVPSGSGGIAGMALHTACGLLLVGIGITGIEYSAARKRLRKWWPIVLAVFIIIADLVVWQALENFGPTADSLLPMMVLVGGLSVSVVTAVLGYLVQTLRRLLAHSESAEIALRESNENLERRVDERTAELVRKNSELDRFSSVVAHDLKSPIASMISFAELIDEELGPRKTADVSDFLQRIGQSGHRALALIDGLLEMARTGSRRPSHIVNADSLLEDSLVNLQSTIQSTGALVTASALPTICGG